MTKFLLIYGLLLGGFMNQPSVAFSQTIGNLWQPYRITPRTGGQHIDLSGAWTLSYTDRQISAPGELTNTVAFQTTVPNSVQWSLYKAGKLPHPYLHKNTERYNWVDEKVWYYRKRVNIPVSASGKQAFLCFEGIDYFARVWVNDSLMGDHEGMFGGPTIEISRWIKPGDSTDIVVEVRAGNWGNKGEYFESFPRSASGSRDYSSRKGYKPKESGRIMIPWLLGGGNGVEMFFPLGIWRDVRLELVDRQYMERPFLVTQSVTDKKAVLDLSFEVLINTPFPYSSLHPTGNVQLNAPTNQQVYAGALTAKIDVLDSAGVSFSQTIPLHLNTGRNWVKQSIELTRPTLWQPNGLGAAHLYRVRITLFRDGTPIDTLSFRHGIRTVAYLPSAGPRLSDVWYHWQYVVNGRKLFVKGINWMFLDPLLDADEARYRWLLQAAKTAGIQLIRVNGGCMVESDTFYEICDELGIMVMQDFPLGNQTTPDFPQPIWECQVTQTIFRLRNHPSLVSYCGGNEFNAYHPENTTTIGILERSLAAFDGTRPFYRTSPDGGSIHTYPDMDPAWYGKLYRNIPWISETGIHSLPEARVFRETVDAGEFTGLGRMWAADFEKTHPDFVHHFTEYGPARVPKMLSRASHISDMANPTLEDITEASQVSAGEFYQVLSEKMQGNYPVTTGLLPWVLMRTWPTAGIQLIDGFGNAGAPYYFLKRTYEATHIALDIDRLLWSAGDKFPVNLSITHADENLLTGGKATVRILDNSFKSLWTKTAARFAGSWSVGTENGGG